MDNANGIKKRVFKNSIYLYFRSFITLLVSLYSSRLVLQAIGVENFGVYQLVGGVVSALSFLNSTMSAAVQRFISYEVGLGNKKSIRATFSSLVNVMLLFSILIFVLIMVAGLYLLQFHLDIGEANLSDVKWVLLFSALSLVVTINSIPYNALLIAYEDMNVFAFLDILNSVLKLGAVLMLFLFKSERLFLYALFLFLSSLIIRFLYFIICKCRHKDATYVFYWNTPLVKSIFAFSGWSSITAFSYMLKNQGMSIIMNSFFGPLLNAAYGIAIQVDSTLRVMFQSFQLSYTPNITKLYAKKDFLHMNKLIYSGAKICTIIVLIISIPIILETDYILSLWLNVVPDYAPMIVRMVLFQTIFIVLGCNTNIAIQATGNIKKTEIVCNGIDLTSILLCVILVSFFEIYYLPFALMAFTTLITVSVRLIYLKKLIPSFNLAKYFKDIFCKIGLSVIIALIFPSIVIKAFDFGLFQFLLVVLMYEGVFLYLVGSFCLLPYEKNMLLELRNKIFNKIN